MKCTLIIVWMCSLDDPGNTRLMDVICSNFNNGSTVWQEIFIDKIFCGLAIGKDFLRNFCGSMITKPHP